MVVRKMMANIGKDEQEAEMVIKTIQMTTFEAARWIAALSVISTFIWSVGGFLALLLWSVYREDVITTAGLASREDILRLERTLGQAAESFDDLSRQITILSRPDDVTVYREPPFAVDGSCVAGEQCQISVFAERHSRAKECELISDMAELIIVANNREYRAPALQVGEPSNLSTTPRIVEPVFDLPRSLPKGEQRAIIRTHYTKCLWQIEGQPETIQESPPFSIMIR
jgi:hypothetical protein